MNGETEEQRIRELNRIYSDIEHRRGAYRNMPRESASPPAQKRETGPDASTRIREALQAMGRGRHDAGPDPVAQGADPETRIRAAFRRMGYSGQDQTLAESRRLAPANGPTDGPINGPGRTRAPDPGQWIESKRRHKTPARETEGAGVLTELKEPKR